MYECARRSFAVDACLLERPQDRVLQRAARKALATGSNEQGSGGGDLLNGSAPGNAFRVDAKRVARVCRVRRQVDDRAPQARRGSVGLLEGALCSSDAATPGVVRAIIYGATPPHPNWASDTATG